MSLDLSSTGIVVLAAGKGIRLNCADSPKVMLKIGGKPIVSYIVDTLKQTGFNREQICSVVGFQKEQVMEHFGDDIIYAVQEEQKGTAHAAYVGMKSLPSEIKQALVIGGDDSAFYTAETILDFINTHREAEAKLSLLSAELDDPGLVGKIVRYPDKSIAIIEKEYWTDLEKNTKEVSTGTFCFDREWFEEIFPTMPPLRKLGEYGLPTTLAIARGQGVKYQVIKLKNPNEWFGINTADELRQADEMKNSTRI
ncbi:MAG: NTP transferase domain-containing protein [Candidatus Magasanikbacteria bacterium]|nr:NTP transferase domain-containing protein [Candidatus Magasanikbacteria bacterium]